MKKPQEIRSEKALYFVSINGANEFESESLVECKRYLASYVKMFGKLIEADGNSYDYYIGMYSITID